MVRPQLDGKNSDGTVELFYKRLSYDLFAIRTGLKGFEASHFMSPAPETTQIKNFASKDRNFIGKKSMDNFSILPKFENIKPITATNDSTVYAMNFVVDAFDEMVKSHENLLRAGRIATNDRANRPSNYLETIKAHKGFQNPINRFFQINKNLYLSFVDNLPRQQVSKITNLSEFMKIYADFLKQNVGGSFYFLSHYVRSNLNPITNTGLVIEIADISYSEDRGKIDEFYLASNFRAYKELAHKFGFIIDKNIPWRLVADISSVKMQDYVSAYNPPTTSTEAIIHDNYNIIDINDFVFMMDNCFEAYNYFNSRNPYTKGFIDTRGCKYERENYIFRNPIEAIELSSVPAEQWFETYIELKNKFSLVNMSESNLLRIKKSAMALHEKVDLQEVITFINGKFNFDQHLPGTNKFNQVSNLLKQQGIQESATKVIAYDYAAKLSKTY